jgi:alpha-L-fucosidase
MSWDLSSFSLQNVVYDDFITGFSGAKFNASAWVDLFANAGARYFVVVTVCTANSYFHGGSCPW